MKKLSIILTLFFISCQQAYAIDAAQHFEKLQAKSSKKYEKLCVETKVKTDKERIACLEAHLEFLQNAFLVYREYYENTITILDLRYGNGLKNTRQ
jgi:DNA mismatch repair ATPase MutL